jgi:hypothetical protein
MSQDNVVALSSPEGLDDPLSKLLLSGAKQPIQHATNTSPLQLPRLVDTPTASSAQR